MQVLQHTADLLASIQGMLGQAAQLGALLGNAERQIQQLQGRVAQLDTAISNAQSDLNSVIDKLADIVGDVVGFFDKDLKRRLEAQKSSLQASIAAWNSERSALFQQIASAQALKSQYQSGISQLQAAIATAQSSVEAARSSVELARRAIDALDFSQGNLKFHGAAFELTFSRKANLEAQLSPFPGVSIEGMTLGASVDGSLGITGRLDLGDDGKPSKLALTASGVFTLAGGGSLGIGVVGDVKAGVEMTVSFKKENGRYNRVDAKATLAVDVEVLPTVGVGLVFRAGAGRKASIKMDLAQLYDRRDAVSSFFTNGDVAALARAFESLTATCRIEDRWIAQAAFGFGYSLAGDGAEVSGSATWADVNHVIVADVEAGSLLRQITDASAIQTLLRGLVNQIEPTVP